MMAFNSIYYRNKYLKEEKERKKESMKEPKKKCLLCHTGQARDLFFCESCLTYPKSKYNLEERIAIIVKMERERRITRKPKGL